MRRRTDFVTIMTIPRIYKKERRLALLFSLSLFSLFVRSYDVIWI